MIHPVFSTPRICRFMSVIYQDLIFPLDRNFTYPLTEQIKPEWKRCGRWWMKAQRSMVNASAGVDCEWQRSVAIVDGWRQRGDRWWMKVKWSMVNEREIEDQKFMIRPGLGESKTAEWFLRDIKDSIFRALVNKNLHQKILPLCTVVEVVEERRRSKIHQPALSREIQDSYMIPERHRNNYT